jgi:hypothetical protein
MIVSSLEYNLLSLCNAVPFENFNLIAILLYSYPYFLEIFYNKVYSIRLFDPLISNVV